MRLPKCALFLVLTSACGSAPPIEAAATTPSHSPAERTAVIDPPTTLACDALPATVPLFRIGDQRGDLVQLVEVRAGRTGIGNLNNIILREINLNGDTITDYWLEEVWAEDDESETYDLQCTNKGACPVEAWVGCDDLIAPLLHRYDEDGFDEIDLADTGRDLGGLHWRDIVTSNRTDFDPDARPTPPLLRRWRIGDDFRYSVVE